MKSRTTVFVASWVKMLLGVAALSDGWGVCKLRAAALPAGCNCRWCGCCIRHWATISVCCSSRACTTVVVTAVAVLQNSSSIQCMLIDVLYLFSSCGACAVCMHQQLGVYQLYVNLRLNRGLQRCHSAGRSQPEDIYIVGKYNTSCHVTNCTVCYG